MSRLYDMDPRHYRFARCVTETPVIERYEPAAKVRWAVAVAVAALAILCLVVPA